MSARTGRAGPRPWSGEDGAEDTGEEAVERAGGKARRSVQAPGPRRTDPGAEDAQGRSRKEKGKGHFAADTLLPS